jgi:hypothetical protein
MDVEKQKQLRAWILVIGILVIVGLMSLGLVMAVRQVFQRVENVVNPVGDFTNDLGTQVAQVLKPTPTILPNPVSVIYEIRSLARLETVQYSVEKVITAEVGQEVFGALFGDRLLFIAHGMVVAGVDMAKLGPQDMWLENDVLYVRLPDAEIFLATLDNQKSYVYDRETGLLTKGDTNLETTARRAAEALIKEAALEDGILDQAQLNAENYMYRLLLQLGYPDIIFAKPTPEPK